MTAQLAATSCRATLAASQPHAIQPAPTDCGGRPFPSLAATPAAMSAAGTRSSRIRRREEEEEGDAPQTAEAAHSACQQNNQMTVSTAMSESQSNPSATGQPPPSSAGVQPLPEQFSRRKKLRRSARLACHLDKLAVVELQLVMQFLDTKSKLKAARCCQRLLHAASGPFAWRDTPSFFVEIQSPADVECVCSSLIRFAPIDLQCTGLTSLGGLLTVPHLWALDLMATGAAVFDELPQLLRHPSMARLAWLWIEESMASADQTVEIMRAVAALPQLRTLDVSLQSAAGPTLQPLVHAPALTDLTIRRNEWTASEAALLNAISQCAGLRQLSLCGVQFLRGSFRSFFTSVSMRRLWRLKLSICLAAGDDLEAIVGNGDLIIAPDADEYRVAFSALEHLQSLLLEAVWGINALLPHLHLAPALCVLSLRCEPENFGSDAADSALPRRAVLTALLAAAPKLEVRLLLPATFDRWVAHGQSPAVLFKPTAAMMKRQWHELQRMAAELDRVTVVDWAPSTVFI